MCIGIERQARRHRPRAEHGISLIELIVFIVIVGIAVAGVVGALSMATRASADPMIQKQALAIAEALLEEVQQRLGDRQRLDRKSTRLNSSHQIISYAVFCLKKKKKKNNSRNEV